MALGASSSSGLEVSYSSDDPEIAEVVDGILYINDVGSTKITAFQNGNENYESAISVEQNITIDKGDQTIDFEIAQSPVTYGDANFDLSATATSGLDVTYESSNESVATISGSTVTIVGVGSADITASQGGDINYNPAPDATSTLAVDKATLTVTADDKTKAFGETNPTLTIEYSGFVNGDEAADLTTEPTAETTADESTDVGMYDISVSGGNDENYSFNYVSGTLTIEKADQTITFNTLSDKMFGEPDFTPGATASSGLDVSYASANEGVATISGNTVTIVGAGETTITASQEGNSNYNAATSVDRTLTVSKADQTITFDLLPTKAFGDEDFDLPATASSGLEVSYTSSDESVAIISGKTVTIVGAGTTSITASQDGNENYSAATDVQQDLIVNKADQTITFDALASKTYGDPDFGLDGSADSGLEVSYSSSDENVATVSGNTVTIIGAGETTITASQNGNSNYNAADDVGQTLTVNKASQSISFSALDNVDLIETTEVTLSASASSGLEVDFTLDSGPATLSGDVLNLTGTGTVFVTATQSGNDNYDAADPVSRSFTVTDSQKEDQTITFDEVETKTFGDPDFTITATASSGLGVTLSSSNENVATINENTVSIVGAGTTDITASQDGNEEYNPADPVIQTLTVEKADQTITFGELIDKTFGDADFDLEATASSGLEISYTSSDESVATISGSTVTILGAGETTITASQVGNENYHPAIDVNHILIINKAEQTIQFNALEDVDINQQTEITLSATSSSGLNVSFTLESGPATLNGATLTLSGTGVVSITASQSGNENYSAADPITRSFSVTDSQKDEQTISFTAISEKTYGDPDFELEATASSGLEVSYTSSDQEVVTINGSTVSIMGAGTTLITAFQEGNEQFNPAQEVVQELIVNKASQMITFNEIPAKSVEDPAFDLNASASSGLSVTYSISDESIATISGNTVTIEGAGTATITANQEGNENYKAADPVEQVLSVKAEKANQTITFNALENKTYGDEPFELSAASSSGLEIFYSSSNEDAAVVSGNVVTIVGAGTTIITARQEGNDEYHAASLVERELTIKKATQAISFDPIDDIILGSVETIELSATTTSGLEISYEVSGPVSLEENILIITGTGAVSVTANQNGNDNYLAADPVTAEFNVVEATLNVRKQPDVKVYPNPASRYIKIEGILHSELKIFSNTGKMVRKLGDYSGEKIDLGSLNSGIYYLLYRSNGEPQSMKLIIEK